MAAYDRSTILPCQLEPTSTVANGESDTTNSYYSSDSDSSAAMRQPRTSLTYAQATPIGASATVAPQHSHSPQAQTQSSDK